MAQATIGAYFNVKKRSALDEAKAQSVRKVLVLENECESSSLKKTAAYDANEVRANRKATSTAPRTRKVVKLYSKTSKGHANSAHPPNNVLDAMFDKLNKASKSNSTKDDVEVVSKRESLPKNNNHIIHVTPPTTPTKATIVTQPDEQLKQLKSKLLRSNRLNELKKAIDKFKECENKLKVAEEKTAAILQKPSSSAAHSSPGLKTFKDIEFEVCLSPQKATPVDKCYLSPKKDLSPRKNLTKLFSPVKAVPQNATDSLLLLSPNTIAREGRPSLTLPYHYRAIAEFFRAIDTVAQIMFNRSEQITFRKLQKSVEQMLKRNLHEKHLGQIKTLYPDAYTIEGRKLKVFGEGVKRERWELLLTPNCCASNNFTAELLLQRRRHMYNILIEKVKDYHLEFLHNLDPPLHIPREKITRWHPEFDIEKIPDVPAHALPQPDVADQLTSGKAVLEKARALFGSNTRMERALERLQQSQTDERAIQQATVDVSKQQQQQPQPPTTSLLKGIPKVLLERVRQKQAAKALASMTRSESKEKEATLYSRLAEIARLTRNLFVSERKSVLAMDVVVEKLINSYRVLLSKAEMQEALHTLVEHTPNWLVLHHVRDVQFLKMAKSIDLNLIMNKLDTLYKQKQV